MRTYKNHIELTNEQKEMMKLIGYEKGDCSLTSTFSKTISDCLNKFLELKLVVNPFGIDVPAIIYIDQYETNSKDYSEVYVPVKTILREIRILKGIGVNIDIEEIEGI